MTQKSSRKSEPAPSGKTPDVNGEYQLYRLYVSASSPLSSRATVNARRFLEICLPGKHRLEVVDLATNVPLAKSDQVIASPTLVRLHPLPVRRFIGDMSDTRRLQETLGLMPVSGQS